MIIPDREYYRARAKAERAIAEGYGDGPVRAVHERLADAYELRARAIDEGRETR